MGRVILHIGTHKTATTSIQYFLHENRDALAARGVFYPDYSLIGASSHYAHLGMVNALSGKHPKYSAEKARQFFQTALDRARDYDLTIFSAEPFYRHIFPETEDGAEFHPDRYWDARRRYIRMIAEIVGEAEIFVVFRRQAEYVQSLYNEHVKVTRYRRRFRRFQDDFWFHFAYLDQTKAWNATFPEIRVACFEWLKRNGDPVGEFARLLGLPVENLPRAAHRNVTLAPDLALLKRMLHGGPESKETIRRKIDNLAASLPEGLFAELEPRSFFQDAKTRRKYQERFHADNEALRPFLVHAHDADAPMFPRGFEESRNYGDEPHPRLLAALVDGTLGAQEARKPGKAPR